MKKMLIAALLFYAPVTSQASDMVQLTLIEHVAPVTQFRSGETKIALLDSVVMIGSYHGLSIFDLQAGFNGEVDADSGEVSSANMLAGGFLKVSTLIHGKAKYPAHWRFLNSLEHGPSLFYDFREKQWYGSYNVGMAFTLSPKSVQ